MKILVFGSNGQVGRSIRDIENTHFGKFSLTFFSKNELDISDEKLCREVLLRERPSLIINAAAYTSVDNAESDYENANLINNIAVTNIANICKELDIFLIHYSTDYVFDGSKKSAYTEEDATKPKSVYGKSKLNGEEGIIKSDCKYIIFRTSWVFSQYGTNFLKTILNLSQHKKNISVVNDQYGCPTFAKDIAIATSKVIPFISNEKYVGIYNYCGNYSCSWYEFAEKIIASNKNSSNFDIKLKQIVSEEYITKAPRPYNSKLDCKKFNKTFGETFTYIDEAIRIVTQRLKKQ